MSYPFFRCTSCNAPIQQVISYQLGKLPFEILTRNDVALSGVFETDKLFAFCRGQGMRYSEPDSLAVVEFVEGYHFNFTAAFKGYCCFCAMHAGLGTELFLGVACYSCKHKQAALALFVELTASKPGTFTSWHTHRWAALPSVIIDKIIRIAVGNQLSVEDGSMVAPVPDGNFE